LEDGDYISVPHRVNETDPLVPGRRHAGSRGRTRP